MTIRSAPSSRGLCDRCGLRALCRDRRRDRRAALQIARLAVADLQADNGAPRLLMPTRAKAAAASPASGRCRSRRRWRPSSRATARPTHRSCSAPTAARGSRAGRRSRAALPRGGGARRHHRHDVRAAALARSFRSLLANVPQVVCASTTPAVVMLERVYSATSPTSPTRWRGQPCWQRRRPWRPPTAAGSWRSPAAAMKKKRRKPPAPEGEAL